MRHPRAALRCLERSHARVRSDADAFLRAHAAFADRIYALTATPGIAGVVIADGYPGKIPELMTPSVNSAGAARSLAPPLPRHSRAPATARVQAKS